jgi:hypothetical protein
MRYAQDTAVGGGEAGGLARGGGFDSRCGAAVANALCWAAVAQSVMHAHLPNRRPPPGIVLVAPCYTAMNYTSEQKSGWYDDPWLWDSIRANSGFITQFSSTNDRLIPWDEHQHVADNLHSELHMWAPLVLGGGVGGCSSVERAAGASRKRGRERATQGPSNPSPTPTPTRWLCAPEHPATAPPQLPRQHAQGPLFEEEGPGDRGGHNQ